MMIQFALSRVVLPYQIESCRQLGPVMWIRDVFGRNYITILWLIGDIMSDQGQCRLLISYRPGDIGKSTVVSLIVWLISSGWYTIASQKLILTGRGMSWSEQLQQTNMLEITRCRVVHKKLKRPITACPQVCHTEMVYRSSQCQQVQRFWQCS